MKKLLFTFLFIVASIACWAEEPTYLTIVGGATKSGWTENEYHRTVGRMVRTAENTWVWVGQLTAADGDTGNFKIPNTLTGWDGYWADEANKQIGVSDVEEFTLSTASAGDKKFHVTSTGMYRITVNTNTLKMTVEKLTEPTKDGDYYLIGNVDQLMWYAGFVTSGENEAKARLTADISFEGKNFFPISSDKFKFKGELDGAEHIIDYAVIDDPSPRHGLCRYLGPGANIHDLIMGEHCSFTGLEKTGGIAGHARDGGTVTLTNVINRANVTSTGGGSGHEGHAAGLVAAVTDATQIVAVNCANMGNVKGQNGECASLAGWVPDGAASTFTNCWNIGNIESDLDGASNQLCRNQNHVTLTNCYNLTSQGSQGTHLEAGALGSGELCFKLNGDQSDIAWYQNLSGTVDAYPVPFSSHTRVYANGEMKCDGTAVEGGELTYSNSESSVIPPHNYDDGWCTVCNAYQENAFSPIDGWYQISTAKQLRWIAESVNEYNSTYKGINIKLTSDIDYRTYTDQAAMIGKPSNTYKGTFDGQNHIVTVAFNNTVDAETGLFRRVNGGTIQNLKVDGTITTNKSFAGGICSGIWQNGTIANCESAVTINDTESGDATHGGILARAEDQKDIRVINCLFSGTLNASSRNGCGGIVGWTGNSNNTKVKNCLVSGTLTIADANTNGIIARSSGDIENNYYTCTVSGSNIKKDYATEASAIKGTGELCYLLNGRVSGGTGWYQTIGTDDMPTPFNSSSVVYANGEFQCDGVTPKGTTTYSNTDDTVIDPHNFVNNLCSVCKAVGEEPSNVEGVYQIANIGHLIWFATHVNTGSTTASGVLTDNIVQGDAVYVPIGTEDNIYTGHFDGQGHTVDLDLKNSTKNYQGLFGVVTDGVYIEKVIVTGSVSGNNYVGGIVGGTKGGSGNALQTNIWYCGNEAAITAAAANAGGIIGVNMLGEASIILTNCYNRGNIQGGSDSGALSGWLGGGWSSVRNCYNTGKVKNGETDSKAFGRNDGCYFKNCYYTTLSDTDNSTEDTSNGVPAVVEDATVASGELCAKLGYGFRQNLGEDAYPNFNVDHGFVNQISAVGYSTQYNAMSDVTIPDDVEAFAGVKNSSWVTLVPVEGKIKAGVPVVLIASPGCYNFMPTTGAEEPANNDLQGSDGSVPFGGNIYVLAKKSKGIGFYKTGGSGKVPEGRAYLNNSGSLVKEAYLFSFDDEETAIANVNVNGNGNNAAIYNMAGQRISKLQKGINIVNGKKVLF